MKPHWSPTYLAIVLMAAGMFHCPARADGNPAAGRGVFRINCSVCHQTIAGKNSIGPSLFGVVDRAAGQMAGYNYSPAMKSSGLVWTEANLWRFLALPVGMVPRTKMTFPGLADPDQRTDLVAFLKSLQALTPAAATVPSNPQSTVPQPNQP